MTIYHLNEQNMTKLMERRMTCSNVRSNIISTDFTKIKHVISSKKIKSAFESISYIFELHQAKRGLMVILKNFFRYISAFDYYEGIYWFCANTFENKMLQYFTETSESHIGYFQLWHHILRHLRHLLALCWKSHKPPFRLAQLICVKSTVHLHYYQLLHTNWWHCIVKVCLTKSADLSVFVLFRIIIIFFLLSYFSLPPTCVSRFLLYFLTNLNEIWHGHSPWWDEEMLEISSQ